MSESGMISNWVRRMGIAALLRLLVALPVAALLIISAFVLVEQQKIVSNTARLRSLIELASVCSDLIHEIQRERGASAVFLGASDEGFADRLTDQRRRTDIEYRKWQDHLSHFDALSHGLMMREAVAEASVAVHNLFSARKDVDQRRQGVEESFLLHTGTIREILGIIAVIAQVSASPDLVNMVSSYLDFVNGKEKAGQERAIGALGFSVGRFDYPLFLHFVKTVAAQETFFDSFKDRASREAIRYWRSVVVGEDVDLAARMREIALLSGPGVKLNTEGGPQWYMATTRTIDLQDQVRKRLEEDLYALGDREVSRASRNRNATAAGLAVVMIGLLWLSILIARSLRDPLQQITCALKELAAGRSDVLIESEKMSNEFAAMSKAVMAFRDSLIRTASLTADLRGEIERRQQSERRLRRLSRAIEQSPNGVVLTDLAGRIEYVNPRFCEMSGYQAGEVLGRTPRIVKSPSTPFAMHESLWRTIANGEVWRGELQDCHKSGTSYWVSLTVAPVHDEHGEPDGYVGIQEDIGERKRAEIALRSAKETAEIANRAKSELLANMSHELRTPLNAIIGFSETMSMAIFGPLGSNKYEEYVSDIQLAGRHLLSLINDVLDMSAIEAGKLIIGEDKVECEEAIASMIRMVHHRANEKELLLDWSCAPADLALWADERRFKQILLNLLTNAIKFTERGGQVTVAVEVDEQDRPLLRVSDTGIGMTNEEVRLALTPFGQVERSHARTNEGSGLGLPLTHGLIDLHGGEMQIQSQPGKGTTVTVIFPASRLVKTKS
jgi:PAS domain S-box-containing protein